jgi:multidrug resistance protein, MATE family
MTLTRYLEGSFRELWKIALPLMLSSLSVMSMIFVDRLLLARFSTAALNAAANAATFGWSFIYGWMVLTSISEVFVAQYNGAGQKEKIGQPVWQMIWLSLFSLFFFIPLAYWGPERWYGGSEKWQLEKEYFHWMILFGSCYSIYGALSGFFIGQGRTALVTWMAIVSNIINVVVDILLIFGVEGWWEPMGVKGAAIATSASSFFQMLVLGLVFLNRTNRNSCGTGKFVLNWEMMRHCIRVGLPNALFATVEILGWAAFYHMMTLVSERHITIAAIAQSTAILLYFFAEGVSKAASAVAGNLIGAGRPQLISKMVQSGVWLHLSFFALTVLLCLFYSDFIIVQFFPSTTIESLASMESSLKISIFMMTAYLFFEGLRLLFAGVLTAAGDTFFLLTAGSLSVWLLLVLPVYLFVVVAHMSIEVGMLICVVYSFSACLIYLVRLMQGQWKESSILV